MMSRLQGGLLLLAISCSASLVACNKNKKKAEQPEAIAMGRRSDDMARCEFVGRDDRDVQESSAPGSVVANVRRVYGYIGAGDERRRILLCREVDSNFDGVKDLVRTYGDNGEKLMEQADSDYDGKIDTWITFGASHPAKMEFDRNSDGKADEVKFYVTGQLSRVQKDTNGDEKPDVFEIYRNGRLERMGIDADYDGKVDAWHRDEVRAAAEEAKELEEAAKAEAAQKKQADKAEDAAD